MSLEDEYEDEIADAHTVDEPSAKVEWSGSEGTIQTGPKPASWNPRNYGAVAQEFGEDPAITTLELVGGTKWLQSRRIASYLSTSNRPNSVNGQEWVREFEDKWLYAYRYKFHRDTLVLDLPGLYAEVEKTKQAKQFHPRVGDSTVVVCWADIQTGKVDHLGGLQEMLERLEQKRQALAAYLRRQDFDHIVIADVGDIVEGFSNVASQTRMNCLSIMDQVDVAATEFWKTIRLCAQLAPVDVLSIPSNHGQWRKGKELIGKPTDDWGLNISKQLERRNEDAGLPVTFHRTNEWDESLVFDIRGTRLGLAHGHQANNPDQVKTWWGKMTHAGVLDCHVLLTGHFHFASLRPSGKDAQTGKSRWHIQASTLDNGSAWVRNKMGEDGDPALTVFKINDAGFDVQSFALL